MKLFFKQRFRRSSVRRLASWTSLAALIVSIVLPTTASAAGQLTSRSVTITNSAPAATGVTYTAVFTLSASQTLGAVKVEICDSPLATTSCVNSGGSSGATFTPVTSATLTGSSGTWTLGTHTGNSLIIGNASPVAGQTGQITVVMNGVTNPTATNTSFYVRMSTYTNQAASTPAYPGTDFGAAALSTANQITTTANVQESLTFCVGTSGTGCSGGGLTGTSVNLGTGGDNVLSASSPSGGTSLMAADTNATTGYVITYLANNLSSTNDTITAAGGTAGTFTAGTSKFGINLRDNATPNIGSNISGSGSGAVGAQYNIIDNFAFVPATATTVASTSGPTLSNLYTVSYAAQAGSTTKPGAYSTTFTWVCTGTF